MTIGTNSERIKIYEQNHYYWQYKGSPLLLVGGTKEDNLFQIPDLAEHLELLASVGGNYIRNTMSDRDEGDVKAFAVLPDGKFDLNQWNQEYWHRFETMLQITEKLDIIVQIELWDQWDHQNGRDDCWENNPWNPDCNINYSTDNTSLKGRNAYRKVDSSSGEKHDLFLTVPELNNDTVVLDYQKKFIDKILSYTLECGNVLYTITNELFIQHSTAWSDFWAVHLKRCAEDAGVEIHVTEMFQITDLEHPQHRGVLDHPELYTFFDMSQNAGKRNETHWEKIQWAHQRVAAAPRPLNNVKMYGADGGWLDSTTKDAVERFWRNIIGGAASVRFHRPPVGLGLDDTAQACLKAAELLVGRVDMWELSSDMDAVKGNELNTVYCTSKPGSVYVLYMTDGGVVNLDLTGRPGNYIVNWINGSKGCMGRISELSGDRRIDIEAPGLGPWVAIISK